MPHKYLILLMFILAADEARQTLRRHPRGSAAFCVRIVTMCA
jgi:hypothetical protein